MKGDDIMQESGSLICLDESDQCNGGQYEGVFSLKNTQQKISLHGQPSRV